MMVVHQDIVKQRVEVTKQRFFTASILFVISLYAVIGIAQAHFWQWLSMTDSMAYLQMARQYANGEFVVRGYWSPLVSWLTAILIKFGIPPEIAGRYILVISGVATIVLSLQVAKRFQLRRASQFGFVLVTMLLVLLHHIWITADIIGVACLMAYFLILIHPSVEKKPLMMGMLAGIAAGIAYFARSYNLTFIVVHLVVYILWGRLQRKTFKSLMSFAATLLVAMAIVISPWIYLLSVRYERLTFSTSALHTRGLVAPGAKDWVACMNGSVLCNRPTDILFPWEDHLPELQPNYNWSPFSSPSNFQHQVKLILDNIEFFALLNIFWCLFGLLDALLLFLFWRRRNFRNMELLLLLLTAGIYVGGYMLTLSLGGTRYFIFPYIMIFLILFYCLQHLRSSIKGPSARVISVLIYGLMAISFANTVNSISLNIIEILVGAERPGVCIPRDAQQIAPYLIPPFALIEPEAIDIHMMDLSYNTQLRTLGFLRSDLFSADELNTKLQENGIRTVLVREGIAAAGTLATEYDYADVAEITFCDLPYRVLRVPEAK